MENPSEQNRNWLELSLAQQAIWLDAKLSGESLYQLGGWTRVSGPIDEAAARQAVSLIMARHDALRLRVDDEQPRQWLDASAAVHPPFAVITLPPGDDPDHAFQSHAEKAFAAPMPWGDHPLFRIELVRAAPHLNYLLWRFHHLLADSNSTTITRNHWSNAYLALTSDDPPELAPRSSYLRTIESDATYLKSPAYQGDLSYWVSRFDPLPPTLLPPGSKPSAAPQGPFYADAALDSRATARLEQAARTLGVTPQRALFALFAIALAHRYGQSDLVVGLALHRRDASDRHALGLLSGILPIRSRFNPSLSLKQGIQSFSAQVDSDLRHQRMPVDKLSRALNLFRTGRARLYEVVMSYIAAVSDKAEPMPGVTGGVVALPEASPISLHVTELPENLGLTIRLCVNPRVLDTAEAPALLQLLQSTLDIFLTTPGLRIEDLPPAAPAGPQPPDQETEEWTI